MQILDECIAAAMPEGATPSPEPSSEAQIGAVQLPAVPLTKFRAEGASGQDTPPPTAAEAAARDIPILSDQNKLGRIKDARAQARRVPSFDWTNPSFRANSRKSRSTGSESGPPTPLMSVERDISRAAIMKPYLAAQAQAGNEETALALELNSRLCGSICELDEARSEKKGGN